MDEDIYARSAVVAEHIVGRASYDDAGAGVGEVLHDIGERIVDGVGHECDSVVPRELSVAHTEAHGGAHEARHALIVLLEELAAHAGVSGGLPKEAFVVVFDAEAVGEAFAEFASSGAELSSDGDDEGALGVVAVGHG